MASIFFYCIFTAFAYYQQVHLKNFDGTSERVQAALSLSVFTAMLTGCAYLIYLGISVTWWYPIVAFVLSLLFQVVSAIAERLVGALSISMAGFVGWPLSAVLMFVFVPEHGAP